MKSSSGAYYIAIDHVRALAVFMVFTWHFIHGPGGYIVPFNYHPVLFPLSLLAEGQTGVALFMTLSGYLFAKLLDGKSVDYKLFLWNRALRLLPLLVFVFLLVGIRSFLNGENLLAYVLSLVKGIVLPTLPNGGWSITVEFHYYAILPLFLWMLRKSKLLPLSIVVGAVLLRWYIYRENGSVQSLAYWTIIGRIDQFTLGMLAFQFRAYLKNRHLVAMAIMASFAWFYWRFDLIGGFFQNPSFPSPNPLWIVLPTIEGAAYAVGIAWYESSFSFSTSGFSKFVGRIGEYSYSIYLFHFFIYDKAAQFVHGQIMDISNFYLACLWSIVFFLLMIPVGYLSFRFIEAPFLRLRKHYVVLSRNAEVSI